MLRSTLIGITLLGAGLALAQTPPPQQKLEPVEEAETAITNKPKTQTPPGRVKEKTRQTERGTETEVDTGRTTYTVKQQTPAGNAAVGDVASGSGVRGTTTFKVLEFDLNRKKKPDDKDAAPAEGAAAASAPAASAATRASVPPPPPMQPQTK
jgi:hypothetical protein